MFYVEQVGWDINKFLRIITRIFIILSWNWDWGISGYMYLIRNKNMCGIASAPTYPLI